MRHVLMAVFGSLWLRFAAMLANERGEFVVPATGGDPAAGGAAEPEATDPVADDLAPEGDDPAAAAAGAPEGGEPDDDDPEDAGLAPEVRDNPTRLRTRLRRTQRQLAQLRPIAERLRGENGEPVDIDQVLYAARQYREMEAAMRRNPQLRSAIYGEPAIDGAREPEMPAFDEAALPFDTTTAEGQFFARQARQLHDTQAMLQRLERQLEQGNRRSSEESAARHEETWQSAAMAAAQQISPEYRRMFVEAVYGRFFRAQAANQLGSLKAQDVINSLLKGLNLTKDQRTRASHAAGARIAESNRRLPQAPRGGAAAAPQQKPAQPTTRTVADVSRDFLKRNAG